MRGLALALPIAGEYLDRWWQANLGNPKVMVEWLRGVNIESITAWTSASGARCCIDYSLPGYADRAVPRVPRWRIGSADRVLTTVDLLLGDPGERLARKIADAVRGIVNGTVAVAVAEGAIIGIAYLLAGLSQPLLFGVLTIAFAMVPFGAWIALTVAVLLLLLDGASLLVAAALFGFGAAVMLIADNIIQPALIGGATRLPFLLVLIGILGGLQSFGLVGLFLGPVIMAAVLAVWREWMGIGD